MSDAFLSLLKSTRKHNTRHSQAPDLDRHLTPLLQYFRYRHQPQPQRNFESVFFWYQQNFVGGGLVFSLLAIGLLAWPTFRSGPVVAGQIEPVHGSIQILRDGQQLEVSELTKLLVGDWVQVGDRSRAQIELSDQILSTVEEGSFLRVAGTDKLFVERGNINNQALEGAEISTGRGAIVSPDGAQFRVMVSPTGETQVFPIRKSVQVFDLQDGSRQLTAGDQLALRSDTRLAEVPFTRSTKLSLAQERAVRAKLDVVRSKLMTGLIAWKTGAEVLAEENFVSAQRSFLSIAQLIRTNREELIVQRRDQELSEVSLVGDLLASRTDDEFLIKDSRALMLMFDWLNSDLLTAWSTSSEFTQTGIREFDRYQALYALLRLSPTEERTQVAHFLTRYITNFLWSIEDIPLQIDRIAALNERISQLPSTLEAEAFLKQLENQLSPAIASIVQEKRLSLF